METIYASLLLCVGNPPVTKGPVIESLNIFFVLHVTSFGRKGRVAGDLIRRKAHVVSFNCKVIKNLFVTKLLRIA